MMDSTFWFMLLYVAIGYIGGWLGKSWVDKGGPK